MKNLIENLETIIFTFFNILIQTILIILIAYFIIKIILFVVNKILGLIIKSKKSSNQRIITIKSIVLNLIKYFFWLVTFIVILFSFGVTWQAILASAGVLGVIISIGAQELISDTVNGFFVIFEGTYDIGEYVKVGEFEGFVVGLGIKSTVLQTYESELITIPNSKIHEVINYSKNEYNLYYSFTAPYSEEITKIESVIKSEIIPTVVDLKYVSACEYLGISELGSSSVEYMLQIRTKPENRFMVKRSTNSIIKDTFDKNNIEIPFEQLTISYGSKQNV